MRKLVIEVAAAALVVGPMLVVIASVTGQVVSWTSAASVLATALGAIGIALACRESAPISVRAKRIVALMLFGLLVPLLFASALAAAQEKAWGIAGGAAIAAVLVAFGLSRFTSLNILSWIAADSGMPPNTSLERTREK